MIDTSYIQRVPEGTVHYEDASLRIFARYEEMRPEKNYHASLHWHDEIELMHIVRGRICYSIDGRTIPAEEGDIVFVNSAQMHASFLRDSPACDFNIVLVHPSVFTCAVSISQTMITPVFENQDVPFLICRDEDLASVIDNMVQIQNQKEAGYQLDLTACAWHLMKLLYQKCIRQKDVPEDHDTRDMGLLTTMACYVYQHYPEKVLLKQIAESANVSVSTCSRLFSQYLKKSPIDFLNSYRLEVSSARLRTTRDPIGKISLDCGFDQQAYFSRMFRKAYGVTPADYRKHPTDLYVH